MLSFFPQDVLDEILDFIESISESFPTYSWYILTSAYDHLNELTTGTEYREVHGGMGYGRSEPDVEGERILEYALAFDLLLGNTFQET